MKIIKGLSALSALILLSLIYFTACNDKKDMNSPANQDLNLDSPSLAVIDYTDVVNAVQDATIDSDMSFNNTLLNYTFLNSTDGFTPESAMMKSNAWLANFDFTKHLGRVLRGLNITPDQLTSIKGFAKTFHDSMKVYVKQFYNANKDTIANAKIKRKAIVDSVKSGLITRIKAIADIKVLNQETRSKIANNSASLAIKAEMCADRTTFFRNIASILTADQLTKWNQKIAQIKSPC
jgi:hypothetical protein